MKNNRNFQKLEIGRPLYAFTKKIPLVMKLFIFYLFCSIGMLQAVESYAQNARLSLNVEEETVANILQQIENVSDFDFFYNNSHVDLNRRVSVSTRNSDIFTILDEVFRGTKVNYTVLDKKIILSTELKSIEQTSTTQQNDGKINVNGKVTDAKGETVIGASIMEKGTSNGVISDIDGNFNIKVTKDAILQISFLGYATQEVTIKDSKPLNIVLKEDAQALDEVVVVGYGSMKKSVITGAISSINTKNVKPVATQRVDQMLQGQAAGVMVLNTDGAPGADTKIRIRGMNSIQGGNNALIVIDGFQGGDLKSLNPNDIESMEILKDAAATAIYGAQGANGVILITTKKGNTEKPSINYSSEVGFQNILMGGVELMGAADYARELNKIEMAQDLDRVPIPPFTDDQIAALEKSGGTNWIDEVYRTAVIQNHQLSISGKTSKVNYYISGAFLDQDGIMIESGYSRYSLRTNIGTKINDWLDISLNWDGAIQNTFGAGAGSDVDWVDNPVLNATMFSPTFPVYDENGAYSKADNRIGFPVVWNPVACAKEVQNDKRQIHNNIYLSLNFRLLKHLTLQISGGAGIWQEEKNQFFNNNTHVGLQSNGVGNINNSYSKDLQNTNVLNFTRDFGRHNLNVTAVGEIKVNDGQWSNINNKNFTNHETGIYDMNSAQIQTTSSGQSHRKMLSGVGRINYAYDNKYLFSFSFRADGSSVFGENNKWGFFPAASVGWRMSHEKFMKNLSWLDDLMFRFSWGNTGNQAISNFQTLPQIGSKGRYPWYGNGSPVMGYGIISAANPNLKWENTRQINVGFNFSLWSGKLMFTGEYYDKVTSNLLMYRELPRTTGLKSIMDNVGKMGNRGWEISLNSNLQFNELQWSPSINATFQKTEVLDLGDQDYIAYSAGGSGAGTTFPFSYLRKGEPFGQLMGFGYEGTWKSDEFEEAAKYGQIPGDPKYTDVNGDYKIDYDHDWKVIGNTLPKVIYGFNNRFTYKDFDLNFLIQGALGNDIFNVARIQRDESFGLGVAKFDRWTPDHQNTDVPALHSDKFREEYRLKWDKEHPDQPFISTVSFPQSAGNVNSRWIESGSYLRLKNLTLGYTFKNVSVFEKIRIYLTATNLLTITKYKGFDPEVSSFAGNDATLGTDFSSYPSSRVINFGINVNL